MMNYESFQNCFLFIQQNELKGCPSGKIIDYKIQFSSVKYDPSTLLTKLKVVTNNLS